MSNLDIRKSLADIIDQDDVVVDLVDERLRKGIARDIINRAYEMFVDLFSRRVNSDFLYNLTFLTIGLLPLAR